MKRQQYDVTQNSTVTVDLVDDQDLDLLLVTAGAGSYTVTFAGVDKWISTTGTAPAQPTAVGAAARWSFFQVDGVTYGEKATETGPAGSAGSTGPAGTTWRHTWASGTTYAANDLVYFNGSSFIALQASSSTDPQQPDLAPTYWEPLVSGGGPASSTTQYDDVFTRTGGYPAVLSGAGSPFTYTALVGATTSLEVSAANVMHVKTANVGSTVYKMRAEQDAASSDNWAQCQVASITVAASNIIRLSLCCRCDSAADTGFMVRFTSGTASTTGTFTFYRVVAGALTNITGSTALTIAAGDIYKLGVVGTTLTFYKNGSQIGQVLNVSTITTGLRCGFELQRQGSGSEISLSDFQFGV